MIGSKSPEEKKEKKIAKVMLRSFLAVGIGVGLFFLKFLVIPLLGLEDNENAVNAISAFSLYLIFYGVVLILVFLFKKDMVLKINLIMNYIVVPILAMKLITDVT